MRATESVATDAESQVDRHESRTAGATVPRKGHDVAGWAGYLNRLLSDAGHEHGSITPMGAQATPAGVSPVADGVLKMLVRDRQDSPWAVALCASHASPGLVDRGMDLAEEVRHLLGPPQRPAILVPLARGQWDGLSCAVLPYCRPLRKSRIRGALERRCLRGPLSSWLDALTEATVRGPADAQVERAFAGPLERMAAHRSLPPSLRGLADEALRALEGSAFAPRHVVAHNDLWEGNILLDDRGVTGRMQLPWYERFVVIDWPGARVDGFPVLDLLRLSRAFAIRGAALDAALDRHATLLGCEAHACRWHLAGALAAILDRLEHFPLPMYIRMAESCLSMLNEWEGRRT